MCRGMVVCNEIQSVACITNTDNKMNTKERMMKSEKGFCFSNTPGEAKQRRKDKKKD
jgi:hypothetical protein